MGYAIMALRFMYITNDEQIAKIAEACGVDWIFIDLEINGKSKGKDIWTQLYLAMDRGCTRIKTVLTKSKLLVRVNPIHDGSEAEINKVIHYGADIVMLPFSRMSLKSKPLSGMLIRKQKYVYW